MMYQQLFDWVLEIPQVIASFGSWLVTPLYPPYIDVAPLTLLGIGGFNVLIGLIAIHVVRLFV